MRDRREKGYSSRGGGRSQTDTQENKDICTPPLSDGEKPEGKIPRGRGQRLRRPSLHHGLGSPDLEIHLLLYSSV